MQSKEKGDNMRQLTARQKKLLNKIYKSYKPLSWNELEIEDIEQLEQINDTEILYQEVNSYLHDLQWGD